MYKQTIAVTMLIVVPFVSFAEVSTSAKKISSINVEIAGLVPGDFFYFLDRWGENLNTALTFNKKKLALKQIEYANERVAEIKKALEVNKATIDEIMTAREDFEKRVMFAANIVKDEKGRGSDVSLLVEEINDEFDLSRENLKEIFKDHIKSSSNEEERLILLISTLQKGDPQLAGLSKALESATKERESAIKEEDEIDDDLSDEEDLLEDIMGKEISSQKHTDDVTELLSQVGGLIPGGAVLSSKALLNEAKKAHDRGDFSSARKLTKQAENILEDAIDVSEEEETEDDNEFDDSSLRDLEGKLDWSDKKGNGLGI